MQDPNKPGGACLLERMIMKRSNEYIENKLSDFYATNELDGLKRLIYEDVLGYTAVDCMMNKERILGQQESERINSIVDKLAAGVPIQYILNYAWFYGLKFKVNEHVLIPRQETEELVELILKQHSGEDLQILDMGTGSGCIPISLKYHRPGWQVHAIDISTQALDLAKENAAKLKLGIHFFQEDILHPTGSITEHKYDLIVSNPPYVMESEKTNMSRHVLEHEPHLALFVDDQKPLLYYEAILAYAQTNLNAQGCLYFEINEAMGEAIQLLALQSGAWLTVEVLKDLNGKDRMMRLQLKD